MRVIFIKQSTDWSALSAQLFATQTDSAQALASLQRTNPHLDFQKLGLGSVVLVPELAGLKDADGSAGKESKDGSISGNAFAALQNQLLDEVASTTADARAAWASRLESQREVMVALKKLSEVIGSDRDLKAQAEQAQKAAKNDATNAKAAEVTLKALEEDVKAELTSLGKSLGASSPLGKASRGRNKGASDSP